MKSINLMKNVGQFTPPSKIAKYNLPQIICTIYPKSSVQFTPPKLPSVSVLCMNL